MTFIKNKLILRHYARIPILALLIGLFCNSVKGQDIYISEILFVPPGPDVAEFIELRGDPNSIISSGTYFVGLEGDRSGTSEGRVRIVFDLGGLQFGSNGYLAFVMDATLYPAQIDNNGTIISNTGNSGWENLATSISQSNKDMNDLSATFLVITADELPETGNDADSDDDGVIDRSGWVVLDGVSVVDDDFAAEDATDNSEIAHSDIVFSAAPSANVVRPPGATFVLTDNGAVWEADYVARLGHTTGSGSDDWFAADISSVNGDNAAPYRTNSSRVTTADLGSYELANIGGPNFEVTYDGAFEPITPTGSLNLVIASSLISTADIFCHDLTVEPSQTLTVTAGHTLTVNGSISNSGSIVIESGASLLTTSGNSFSGNITFQRSTRYADGRYSFVSSPVQQSATITGSDLGSFVFRYDESVAYGSNEGLNRWINASSDQLETGKGYTQAKQQDISFSGIPNSGVVTVDGLTHTTASGSAAQRGWNLIGNPYPAAISVEEFLAANSNINGAVYLWDDAGSDVARGDNGDYKVVNGLGSIGIGPNGGSFDGYINSMQAFFVQVSTPTANTAVIFQENMRVNGNNLDGSFFRTEAIESDHAHIKLSVSNLKRTIYSETLIGFRSDASATHDRLYDAPKFKGNKALQFYSYLEEEPYAIQGVPLNEKRIRLGFDLASDQNDLFLTVEEMTIHQDIQFEIKDLHTGRVYKVGQDLVIPFSSGAGDQIDRFVLLQKGESNFPEKAIDKITVTYSSIEQSIRVNMDENVQMVNYSIYDLSGKAIRWEEAKQIQDGRMIISTGNISGLYILKIEIPGSVISRKIKF
ncbi:MAG: T9SS type A sorting domain-containing protein [Cyclobacteriaceae bacterium]